jgi:LmbE family N-acetylglucosaminyl deacetylase
MKWIYLSPHLDDAVYSCGGLIDNQTRSGEQVEIWSIMAGDPPAGELSSFARALHQRWGEEGNPVEIRRQEDRHACRLLGAHPRHFPYPDCIYRRSPEKDRPLYAGERDLFGGIHPRDQRLREELSHQLGELLEDGARVVAPLGIGPHVDHLLVRSAVRDLQRVVFYYADVPYRRQPQGVEILTILKKSADWVEMCYALSQDNIQQWAAAAVAYRSQLSTFWSHPEQLAEDLEALVGDCRELSLWKTAGED